MERNNQQTPTQQGNQLVFERSHVKNMLIYAINVNSLVSTNKQFIMQKFLDEHKPDFVLISETKLNSKHYIKFKNYHLLRNDRPL